MAELEKASARKATLLNPTEEDETVHVLSRRLFESVDRSWARGVVQAYKLLWHGHQASFPPEAVRPETVEALAMPSTLKS